MKTYTVSYLQLKKLLLKLFNKQFNCKKDQQYQREIRCSRQMKRRLVKKWLYKMETLFQKFKKQLSRLLKVLSMSLNPLKTRKNSPSTLTKQKIETYRVQKDNKKIIQMALGLLDLILLLIEQLKVALTWKNNLLCLTECVCPTLHQLYQRKISILKLSMSKRRFRVISAMCMK